MISTVAIFGTGFIAASYADAISRSATLRPIGCFDVDPERATAVGMTHRCQVYRSIQELKLASPDIVVNLTASPQHFETTSSLQEAGLVVYSEKPLASSRAETSELLRAATQKNLPFAVAPAFWLGASQQKFADLALAGAIGTVRLATAEVHQGRIETWHPNPGSFYRVGPVADAGIYPLALLTSMMGPICHVSAHSAMLGDQRVRLDGDTFRRVPMTTGLLTGNSTLARYCDSHAASSQMPSPTRDAYVSTVTREHLCSKIG